MDSSFDWAEPFSFFHRFYLWPFHKSMFNQSLSFEYRLARTRVIKKRKRRAELSARSIETFLKKKVDFFIFFFFQTSWWSNSQDRRKNTTKQSCISNYKKTEHIQMYFFRMLSCIMPMYALVTRLLYWRNFVLYLDES